MDFAALPPEINSGRMYSGPGSGSMWAAAAAWGGLSDDLHSAAASYESEIANLTNGPWLGAASASMADTVTEHIAWLNSTAAQAAQTATQAKSAAGAFEAAFSMTVPPPVIAANRSLLMVLVATNVLGQNTPAIAATDAQYAQMWAQDATAMDAYRAASASAAALTPFIPPAPGTNPAELAHQAAPVAQAADTWAATNTQTMLSHLTATVPATLQGITSLLPSTPTTFLSEIAGIAQSLGLTNPFNLLGPANTVAGTTSLNNSYAAETSSSQARNAILSVGYQIMGTEDEILGRFDQLGPLWKSGGSASLGVGAGPAMVSANMGRAGFVGGLSVPPIWAAGVPAMRTVAFALPAGSLDATTDVLATRPGSLFSELALASTAMAGRTAGGTVSPGRRPGVVASAGAPLPQTLPGGPLTGIADELGKLAELRDSGILTDAEFTRQKRRLLGE